MRVLQMILMSDMSRYMFRMHQLVMTLMAIRYLEFG